MGIPGYLDKGGGGGGGGGDHPSLVHPGMGDDTWESLDTWTRGGGVITHPWYIPGWEMILGNPGILGQGGGGGGGGGGGVITHPWYIPGWEMILGNPGILGQGGGDHPSLVHPGMEDDTWEFRDTWTRGGGGGGGGGGVITHPWYIPGCEMILGNPGILGQGGGCILGTSRDGG